MYNYVKGSVNDRFWAKVQKTTNCWIWLASKDIKGYGWFGINSKNVVKAHRFSYELHKGKIPKGIFVCHSCDNPHCVRPNHLWLGTNDDNVQDMVKKMRHTFGERNAMAKLTEKNVMKIKKLLHTGEYTGRQIAKLFNVSGVIISQIKHGTRWKYLWS